MLPLWIISRLSIARKHKIGISAVFGVGLLSVNTLLSSWFCPVLIVTKRLHSEYPPHLLQRSTHQDLRHYLGDSPGGLHGRHRVCRCSAGSLSACDARLVPPHSKAHAQERISYKNSVLRHPSADGFLHDISHQPLFPAEHPRYRRTVSRIKSARKKGYPHYRRGSIACQA